MGTYFLSYARDDGDDPSFRLKTRLHALRRGFKVIRDQEDLPPGVRWQRRLAEIIPDCDALLFLMTRASVESVHCEDEWSWAARAGVPTIPLRFDQVDLPYWAQNVTWVDFTDFADGDEDCIWSLIDTLHRLQEQDSQRRLRTLEERRQAAERQLGKAGHRETDTRARRRLALSQARVAEQRPIAANPDRARHRRDRAINRHLATMDGTAVPAGRAAERHGRLPRVPPHFRDRRRQTKLLAELLRDDAVRLVVVTGPEGIGKSAVVGRVLRAVLKGEQPELASMEVAGTVYLETQGIKRFTVSSMLSELRDLLPEDAKQRLGMLMDDAVPLTTRLHWLVREFGDQRVIVLIDNFEQLVEPTTWEIRDTELGTVLQGLLRQSSEAIKVVLTSRKPPNGLDEHVGSGRIQPIGPLEGLAAADAAKVLRALDRDQSVGLRKASDELIDRAVRLTQGHPKALEALYALLWKGEISLEELALESRPPDEVAQALIGKTFDGLEREERQALQALAVFGLPVSATAVDLLLRDHPPYRDGLRARQVLNRLARMGLVRRRGEHYELGLMDRQWLLDRTLPGEATDRDEDKSPFTAVALMHRAADYFHQQRLPHARCRVLDDLRFHLAEIDLRTRGEEYKLAVRRLVEVADSYLFHWGHADEALQRLRPLDEKVTDRSLRMLVSGTMGRAYRMLGEYEQALDRYDEAVKLAAELGDLGNAAVLLIRTGACHYVLGQPDEAVESYRLAIDAARAAGDRGEEAAALSNLGMCLIEAGEFDQATRLFERAREIAAEAEVTDGQLAAQQWFNLGMVQVELGDRHNALHCFKQSVVHSLRDASTIKARRGRYLQGSAEVLVDLEYVERAIQLAGQAVEIAREISSATLSRDANYVLAMGCLHADVIDAEPETLEAARRAIDASCDFSAGTRGCAAYALQGVIALRQGRRRDAMDSFLNAEALGSKALEHGARNYSVLDARGLALSGLALLAQSRAGAGDDLELDFAMTSMPMPVPMGLPVEDGPELLERAAQVYREARAISSHPGVVRRVRRQLDALLDPDGLLAGVRQAAVPPLDG